MLEKDRAMAHLEAEESGIGRYRRMTTKSQGPPFGGTVGPWLSMQAEGGLEYADTNYG